MCWFSGNFEILQSYIVCIDVHILVCPMGISHELVFLMSIQEQNVCDFNLPLGNINDDLGGSVRLEFGNIELTASAAITVDSTSIAYTGYTNSSGYFVGVVRTSYPNYTP